MRLRSPIALPARQDARGLSHLYTQGTDQGWFPKLLKDDKDLALQGLQVEWGKRPERFRKQSEGRWEGRKAAEAPAEATIGVVLTDRVGDAWKVLLNRGNRPCAKAQGTQGAQGHQGAVGGEASWESAPGPEPG